MTSGRTTPNYRRSCVSGSRFEQAATGNPIGVGSQTLRAAIRPGFDCVPVGLRLHRTAIGPSPLKCEADKKAYRLMRASLGKARAKPGRS